MIYHEGRFNQKVRFSDLPVLATDIDLATDLGGKGLLFIEFKTAGTKISTGQRKTYERLVDASGSAVPTFTVLAYHHTNVEEAITGENSFVHSVWYRFPVQSRFQLYRYEDAKPTVDEFICDLAKVLGYPASKLRKVTEPWEGFVVDLEAEETSSTPYRRGLFLKLFEDGIITEEQVPWDIPDNH